MKTETSPSLELKIAVNEKERQEVLALLKEQGLPVSDITNGTLLYLLIEGEKLTGTAGLDIFDDCALLRSVSLVKEARGKGYGRFLNEQIGHFAKLKGVSWIYLITNTAKDF